MHRGAASSEGCQAEVFTVGTKSDAGEFAMWVLILFYFSGGNPSVAMHDFANKAACEHALATATVLQSELKGIPQIKGACVSKG
jgi:hypothetical protein